MTRSPLFALMLWCMGIGTAAAAETVHAVMDLPKIQQEQTALRAKVQAGEGPSSAWSAGKRREVLKRQDRVLRLVEGKRSAEELSEDQRNALFTDLDGIRAALAGNERERMICRRVRSTGSHRLATTCRTAAQEAQAEAESKRTLHRMIDCSDADNGFGLGQACGTPDPPPAGSGL